MAVKILGATGEFDSVDEVMEKIRKFEELYSSTVQIFRADRISGELHLMSAARHAKRSFSQGTNRSKYLGTEILLYCAAERRIIIAIEKVGIKDNTRGVAIVIVGEAPEDELLASLELKRDDDVLGNDEDKYVKAFGITDEEIEVVGRDRIADLILERIALSELNR